MPQILTFSGQTRLGALDSLRGIAAFAVLLSHAIGVCEWNTDFTRLPIVNHLFDGHSAVTLFFVLSGFVLTFTYLKRPDKPFILIPFYTRRITRIWLPWFAFFLLSLLARETSRFSWPAGQFNEGAWLSSMWSGETSLANLLKQMVFQEHDSSRMLLSQDWSLGVELRASFLIPVFLLLARWHWLALAAAGIGFAYFAHSSGYNCTSFVAGVLAARWYAQMKIYPKWGGRMFILGVIFYQARWLRDVSNAFPFAVQERETWLITTLGCVLIVLGSLQGGLIRRALEQPFLLYLGRISYSLYLLQMIVLICVAPWIAAGLSEIGISSVGLIQFLFLVIISCISLPLADLSERFIEVPCIHLGKRLTAWLEDHSLIRKMRI